MRSDSGQTLMELVVVVAVSVIVVGALVFATIASLRNASFSKNQAQATKLAQEGIERVRVGRDRNQSITIAGSSPAVTSWNGTGNGDAIWDYRIYQSCENSAGGKCYFINVDNAGVLRYLTTYTPTASQILPSGAESISPFQRAIILSDDTATFGSQKTVTAIVTWTDFAGSHESRLTTILGKL